MAKRKVSKRELLIEQCLHDAYCEREGVINEGWMDDLKANFGSKTASLAQRGRNILRGGTNVEKAERTHAAKTSAKIRSYANGLAQTMFDFKRSGGTLGRNIRNIDDVIHRLDLVSKGKVPDGPTNDEPVSNQPSSGVVSNKNGVESPTKTSNSAPEEKSSLPSRSGYYTAGGSAPISTASQVLKKIKKPKTAKKLATTNNQVKPLKPLIPDKPLISLKPGKSPDETISPEAQPAEDGQVQPSTTPAPAPAPAPASSEAAPETPTDEKVPAPVSGDTPEEAALVDNPVSNPTDTIETPPSDKPAEVAKPDGQSVEQPDASKGELVQRQTNPAKFGKFKDYFDFVNNGSQPYGRNISQSLGSGNYDSGKNTGFQLTQVGNSNATPGMRKAKARVIDADEIDNDNIVDAELVDNGSKLALTNDENPESNNTPAALPPPSDSQGNNTPGQNQMLDSIKFSNSPQSERKDPFRGLVSNDFKVRSPREQRHITDHAEGKERRQVKTDRQLRNNQKSAERSKEVQSKKTGNKSKPKGKRSSNGKKKSKGKKK